MSDRSAAVPCTGRTSNQLSAPQHRRSSAYISRSSHRGAAHRHHGYDAHPITAAQSAADEDVLVPPRLFLPRRTMHAILDITHKM
jgi:hypothetical protein